MAIWNKPVLTLTYVAEGAITDGMVVILGTSENQCKAPAAANDPPLGVAMHAAADGEQVSVALMGAVPVIASAAIAVNALVAISTTTGRVATITIGSTTADDRLVGKALSVAAASGDTLSVLLSPSSFVEV
jgi:hypothetical protein